MESIPSTVKVYVGILLSATFFIGLVGNLFVLLSIILYNKLRVKVFNTLVANLALAGLMTDVIGVPMVTLYIVQQWPQWIYDKKLCSISSFLIHTCKITMILTFLMMSIERYYASVKRKIIPSKMIVTCCIVFWVISGSIHSTHAFESTRDQQYNGKNITTCELMGGLVMNDDVRPTITTLAIICTVIIGISFCFLGVTGNHLYYLKKKKIPSSSKIFQSLISDFKFSFIITVLCFTFWLPLWSLTLAGKEDMIKPKIHILSHTVSLLATVFPPIGCLLFSKHIRSSMFDILTGCKGITIRNQQCNKEMSLRKPLTDRVNKTRKEYEIINTPPTFLKGSYKRGNNDDMDNVSIDSKELTPIHSSAKGNSSFNGSDDCIKFCKDTKF